MVATAATATALRRLGSASAVLRQHAAPHGPAASSSQSRVQFLVTRRTPSVYLSAERPTSVQSPSRSAAPVHVQSAETDIISYLDRLILRDQTLPQSSFQAEATTPLQIASSSTSLAAVASSIHMDSVKRKRRKKMRKHKLKKLRKVQRSERQRLKK